MKVNALIVPKGRFEHESGLQVIDDETLKRIAVAARESMEEIPVDYEHVSMKYGEFGKSGKPVKSAEAVLAGFLYPDSFSIERIGLYGDIEFTDEAAELIRAKTFRFLSPVFIYDPRLTKNGELHIESLISLGLTDKPNIAKMPELLNQIHKEERMKELLEKLKTELSIPVETEDSAVLEHAIEAFQAMSNDLKKLKEAFGIDPEASVEDATLVAVNSFAPTAEEWNAMKEEIAALKQKEVSSKVHNAVANGKILPIQREWAMNYAAGDPQGFEKFLTNSRSVVSFGEVVGKNFGGQTEKAPLDPEQERVNALLGIDRELFDKYNKS